MKNCWIISNCNISSQFKLLKGEQNFKERFLLVNEPSGPRALWMFPVKSLRFKSWHRESPDTVLVQWRKGELSTAQRVDHVCCISMYSLNSSCFPLIDIWELPLWFINSPGNLYYFVKRFDLPQHNYVLKDNKVEDLGFSLFSPQSCQPFLQLGTLIIRRSFIVNYRNLEVLSQTHPMT